MHVLKQLHLLSLFGSVYSDTFWNKSALNSVTELKQQINTAFGDLKQGRGKKKTTQKIPTNPEKPPKASLSLVLCQKPKLRLNTWKNSHKNL